MVNPEENQSKNTIIAHDPWEYWRFNRCGREAHQEIHLSPSPKPEVLKTSFQAREVNAHM